MKVLIIVASFLLVQVYGNAINAKCEVSLFTTCINQFAQALGLPSMPSDANVLEKQIKQLEAKGKQGQQQVCNAGSKLGSCLGQEYSDCISVAFLESIGVDAKDAKEFVDISQKTHKTCTQVTFVVDAKCDQITFNISTYLFALTLGLPSMPSNIDVLQNQIKQLEAKGTQGQQQVCNAFKLLKGLLNQEYSDCMTVAFLKSYGESDKDAKEFITISQQLQKTCVQVSFAVDAKCNPKLFTAATNIFAKALDLPSMPSDADVLQNQIKQIEAKGKQGQQQVCIAFKLLKTILGQEYSDCMTVAFLKSIGESDKDANEFVAISQQLETTCAKASFNVNAKCDANLFTQCTNTFAQALGLSAMPTDADVLQNQIKQLESKGKQGQQQVCGAAGNLQSCLGQEFDDCMSVAFLKSIGESDKDAKEFVAISQQLQNTCAQVSFDVNAKCNAKRFTTATNIFAKKLGLPSMPSDADVLQNQIKQIEAKGKQGQLQVCIAFKLLKTILGQEYSDCMTVAFLKSIGESDKDANEFVAISQQLETTCAKASFNVNAKCEASLFTTCINQFAQALGLPSMPSDANVLEKQIKQLEAKGKQGQQQVCNAGSKLGSCLGQEYSDCISVAFLESIGVDAKDAKEFVDISQQTHKTCAQVSFNVNAKCEKSLLQKCGKAFTKAIGMSAPTKDPNVIEKQIKQIEAKGKQGYQQLCSADKNLQNCLGQEYQDCTSLAFLKSLGLSDKDAKEFVDIVKQLEQTCTHVAFSVNDQCQDQLFTTCTNTFAQELGLPEMPTDADVLQTQIRQLESQGKKGQQQVCKAAEHLQSCLGQEYNDCISVAYLKSIGESDKDANEFVTISQQLQKTCVQ